MDVKQLSSGSYDDNINWRKSAWIQAKTPCLTNFLEFLEHVTAQLHAWVPGNVIYLTFKGLWQWQSNHLHKVINWIRNWLYDRKLKVVINSICLSVIAVISGVPQASILDPFLLVIFVNDSDLDNGVINKILKFCRWHKNCRQSWE